MTYQNTENKPRLGGSKVCTHRLSEPAQERTTAMELNVMYQLHSARQPFHETLSQTQSNHVISSTSQRWASKSAASLLTPIESNTGLFIQIPRTQAHNIKRKQRPTNKVVQRDWIITHIPNTEKKRKVSTAKDYLPAEVPKVEKLTADSLLVVSFCLLYKPASELSQSECECDFIAISYSVQVTNSPHWFNNRATSLIVSCTYVPGFAVNKPQQLLSCCSCLIYASESGR